MNRSDMIRHRLVNQQIADTRYQKPEEIVASLVAMQAQEFALAKWAIGLRLPGSREADVDAAFDRGLILRTHLLRPTWHFVTPDDIGWLLALTAPRVHAANKYWYRKFELDDELFKKCAQIFVQELRGGTCLTRSELNVILERNRIQAKGLRLGYLFMQAELEGILCSGPRKGKQFTYALLDERAPHRRQQGRSEALAELAERFFAGRGPATLQDFTYWSGLTMQEARIGAASLSSRFVQEVTDGQTYIYAPDSGKPGSRYQTTFLLPDYDEWGMSYKDRSALRDPVPAPNSASTPHPHYSHSLVIDGVIGGTWQSRIKKKVAAVDTSPFKTLSVEQQQAVVEAVDRYRSFYM